ncbi:MAG: ATP-binding protein [Eubacterium sp.]|nr:ATP-binding protein [Eubacterium sp.]
MAAVLTFDTTNYNDDLKKGMTFAEDALKNIRARIRNKIILALEEAFVNVLKYNEDSSLKITLEIEKKDGFVYVKIEDNGNRFNPLLNKDPDISLDADERKIGGLGVFLLKQISDYIEYEYSDGKNILSFGVKAEEESQAAE